MPGRLRLATVALGLLALAGAIPVYADTFPRVTANTDVSSDDKRPARAHSTPYVVVDPKNPLQVYVSEAELRTRTCKLHVSDDGGRTFHTAKGNPLPPAFQYCTADAGGMAVPMTMTSDGTLLMGLYGVRAQDNGVSSGRSIVVSRTTDQGATWDSVIVRDNRKSDPKESAWQIHLASQGNNVYAAWMSQGKTQSFPRSVNRALVSVSTDAGRTYGKPFDMTAAPGDAAIDPTKQLVGDRTGPSIAVAPDGTIYTLMMTDRVPLDPKGKNQMMDLVVTTSRDSGKTVEAFRVQKRTDFTSFPELALVPQGTSYALVAAFEDISTDAAAAKQQVRDVFYSRSTDGGKTWSQRQRLSDDPASGLFNKFMPSVSAAPNGRVDAAWYDFRNDNGQLLSDIYYTYSTDGGATWAPNLRMSDQQSNRHYGDFAHYSDVRGPIGVGSSDTAAYVAWDDTRNADAVTESQDVYFAAAQLAPLPAEAGTNLAAYAAAVGVGLIVAALVLVIASIPMRRRRDRLTTSPA